jgi:hypothetical protein
MMLYFILGMYTAQSVYQSPARHSCGLASPACTHNVDCCLLSQFPIPPTDAIVLRDGVKAGLLLVLISAQGHLEIGAGKM